MNKNVLIIDNYDSFTYNLVQLLRELGVGYTVWRNDQFDIDDVDQFDYILLSSGPGLPAEAGLLMEVLQRYVSEKHILGVGLGMQAIVDLYGGELFALEEPFHGIATGIKIIDSTETLFEGYSPGSKIARYHSWGVSEDGFPKELKTTAEDEEGLIMAISHKNLPVKGIQFSPDSVLSDNGIILIKNWLEL